MLTEPIPEAVAPRLRREPMYIGGAAAPMFAMLHTDETALPRHCITVICPPIGHEYTHSHRSVRHLADALASAGIPALRLDYHGTGNSPGSDHDPDRLSRWVQDIRVAVAEARRLGGGVPVCLLGIRLGATLAAMAACEVNVDWLVAWFPVVSGRRYLREMQAVALSTPNQVQSAQTPLEAAGFLLTQQTQQAIKSLNLLNIPIKTRIAALLIQRDDLDEDNSLHAHMAYHANSVEAVTCGGFADMMAQPLHTRVPQAAIDATLSWLFKHTALRTQPCLSETRPSSMRFGFTTAEARQVNLIDTACRFGEANSLFGIHTVAADAKKNLPTVVIFSAGVVHNVGPGRLYTQLARNIASLGMPCFRCDLEGIGDSMAPPPVTENHPYPDNAARNAETALAFLQERFGAGRFILMGLCSGAYTSFIASLNPSRFAIVETVLINPLTFHWREGDSLDTDLFRKAAYYRESMRKGNSWMKLLRGQVNLLKVARIALPHLATKLNSHVRSLIERIHPEAGSPLARQLRTLFAKKCRVALFVSSGDPGWDMLASGARLAARQGVKRGDLSVYHIANADHTFSNENARLRLLASMQSHLQRHLESVESNSSGIFASSTDQPAAAAPGKGVARTEVIVLSRNVTGLETIRCLGKTGVKVHAIYFKKNDPVRFSRYCRASFFDDSARDEQALLRHLISYAQKLGNRPIAVPTCDSHALLLARHRAMLAPYCRVMAANFTVLEKVVHKHNLHAEAEQAGVPVVPSIVAPNAKDIKAWSDVHLPPYLIKPFFTGVSTARLKQKNIVVPTQDALLDFVSKGTMQSLIVQRLISGGDGYVFDCYGYCDKNGKIVAMASKRRLRQNLPDYGTCTMGEIPAYLDDTTEATIFANTRKLFEHIKYQGIFGVEWLFDRVEKKFYIIDFNARPFMSISHVAKAGLNLPALAYAELTGQNLSSVVQTPPLRHLIGVDLLRDMESFQVKHRHGELNTRQWLKSLLRCRHLYYADWRDPIPGIARFCEIFRRGTWYLLLRKSH